MVLISVSRVLSQDIQVVLSSVSRVLSPGHGGGLEPSSVYCWVISQVMACRPLLHLPCGSQSRSWRVMLAWSLCRVCPVTQTGCVDWAVISFDCSSTDLGAAVVFRCQNITPSAGLLCLCIGNISRYRHWQLVC